jgi:hypothetical protein
VSDSHQWKSRQSIPSNKMHENIRLEWHQYVGANTYHQCFLIQSKLISLLTNQFILSQYRQCHSVSLKKEKGISVPFYIRSYATYPLSWQQDLIISPCHSLVFLYKRVNVLDDSLYWSSGIKVKLLNIIRLVVNPHIEQFRNASQLKWKLQHEKVNSPTLHSGTRDVLHTSANFSKGAYSKILLVYFSQIPSSVLASSLQYKCVIPSSI